MARSKRSPARLVIALSVAGLLAVFLVYTAVGGSSTPNYAPSQLKLLHDKDKLGEWMETVPEAPELEAGAEKKKGK